MTTAVARCLHWLDAAHTDLSCALLDLSAPLSASDIEGLRREASYGSDLLTYPAGMPEGSVVDLKRAVTHMDRACTAVTDLDILGCLQEAVICIEAAWRIARRHFAQAA